MAYSELVSKRTLSGKTFQDSVDLAKHRFVSVVGPIHYAGIVDGAIDSEVNFDAIKVAMLNSMGGKPRVEIFTMHLDNQQARVMGG